MVVSALLAAPAAAQVPPPGCSVSATDAAVVNCSGNQGAGIALSNAAGPFRVLNVFALTSNIAPVAGTAGIVFSSDEDLALSVATGHWQIVTDSAPAIAAESTGSSNLAASINASIVTNGTAGASIMLATDAGGVAADVAGEIQTVGDGASGIIVGSTGGAISLFVSAGIATNGLQSNGVYAGSGGDIAIAATGNIVTNGDQSMGIGAASTGGTAAIQSSSNISVSGAGSYGIFAEAQFFALVLSEGNISTAGSGAPGIVASAIQGAAVLSESNITTTNDLAPGIIATASAGDAVVFSSGNISTHGMGSNGIIAGASGIAAVFNAGNISATDGSAAGIHADGDDAAIVVNWGTVQGGACCAGIIMDSATIGILENYGTVTANLSDFAIDMMAPDNEALNAGTITGNVRLFDNLSATGTFNNLGTGLLNTGDTFMTGTLNNAGTIAPGGRGAIQTTFVFGDFVQSGSGIYAVDLNPASSDPTTRNDGLAVSGSATLAGKVETRFTSVPLAPAQTFTILGAGTALVDDGLSLSASPVTNANLQFVGNEVILGYSIDFANTGFLNPNQRAIANNLQSIFLADSSGVAPVLLGLLNTQDIEGYRNALDQLSPEVYSDAQIATLYANLAFAHSMLSCRVNGSDTASIIREGQCLWAGASARFMNTGTTRDQIGYRETAGLFTAGVQVALDDAWRLGFAGGFQQSSSSTATNATSDGMLGQAGVALKYNPGSLLLAATLSGGGASYDTKRPLAFGGFAATAEGSADYGFINGGVRAAYVFGSPDLFWKPILDMNLTHIALDGFTESAAGGAGLAVHGSSQTVFSIAPTVEVGSEFWLTNGTLVRPLVRGGAIWYSDDDFALTAGFAQAPAGAGPFTIMTRRDQAMGLVGAGLEIINADNDTLRINYDAQLGETTQIHSVGIRGSASF